MPLLPDYASPEYHLGRYRLTRHPHCDRGERFNLSSRMHRKSRVEQYTRKFVPLVVVVVVVFTLKAVPVSTQYFLTSVLVQLTRTPSVVTG